jgi:hypothetical protein
VIPTNAYLASSSDHEHLLKWSFSVMIKGEPESNRSWRVPQIFSGGGDACRRLGR